MSVGFHIVDASGKHTLKINGEGEIGVAIHDHPPIDEQVTSYPFSQWFTDSGDSGGSNDLLVDGSTVNADFFVCAQPDRDIFVKTISVRIEDASAVLNKFGNLAALTNGVEFFYKNNALGEITIQDQIKTNLDFIRLGLSTVGIGGDTGSFRAEVKGGSGETYLPVIDISQTFGFPWGLRLKKGSEDCLGFRIKDDISTMDAFDIKGFGVQI